MAAAETGTDDGHDGTFATKVMIQQVNIPGAIMYCCLWPFLQYMDC